MIANLQWDNREEGDTPLRQMQLVEIRLLRVVDYICRKHGLTYMLFWGTLLGAVRHKGFIPWDDDIDLWMPEGDCRKFVKIAARELPADIFLQTCRTDCEFSLPWIKLRDAYSSVYTDQKSFDSGAHVGISLDIFPFSTYPRDTVMLRKLQHFTMIIGWYARQRNSESIKVRVLHCLAKVLDPFFDATWYLIRKFSKPISYGSYQKNCSADRYVRCSKDEIFPVRLIEFEGREYFAPANADAVLRRFYGEYMKMPPLDKRICHETNILPFTSCRHERSMRWPKGGCK